MPLRPLAAAVLLALAGAASADPVGLHSALSVDAPTATRADPVAKGRVEGTLGTLYGGLDAATLPQPDRAGDVDVFVGLRPRIGAATLDMRYSRQIDDPDGCCGAIAVALERPLTQRASVGARVVLDTGTDAARTEARAELRPMRATTLGGTVSVDGLGQAPTLDLDLGATRTFSDRVRVRLRQVFASSAAERTELTMAVEF